MLTLAFGSILFLETSGLEGLGHLGSDSTVHKRHTEGKGEHCLFLYKIIVSGGGGIDRSVFPPFPPGDTLHLAALSREPVNSRAMGINNSVRTFCSKVE